MVTVQVDTTTLFSYRFITDLGQWTPTSCVPLAKDNPVQPGPGKGPLPFSQAGGLITFT